MRCERIKDWCNAEVREAESCAGWTQLVEKYEGPFYYVYHSDAEGMPAKTQMAKRSHHAEAALRLAELKKSYLGRPEGRPK